MISFQIAIIRGSSERIRERNTDQYSVVINGKRKENGEVREK